MKRSGHTRAPRETTGGHWEKPAIPKPRRAAPEETSLADTVIWDFQSPELGGNTHTTQAVALCPGSHSKLIQKGTGPAGKEDSFAKG